MSNFHFIVKSDTAKALQKHEVNCLFFRTTSL